MLGKVSGDAPPSYGAISSAAPPTTYQVTPYTDSALAKGVPPGLQPLLQVNQLTISERFTTNQGWGRTFTVLDMMGQSFYQAHQYAQCCGPLYDLKIKDNEGQDVVEVLESCGCRCTREMDVLLPSTGVVGSVKLNWNQFVTHMSVMDSSKEVVLLILGPSFQNNIFGNVIFEVKSRDEQHVVGMIRNDSNRYSVTFPMDLDVSMKALLLASTFYLDYLICSKRKEVMNRRNNN
ncbi:phospholipid scramblase 3-like [Hyperolius riggenbachi]|uniref:phospholipid scramblase 3-like n=1 Tax=Hyperolius riggenbachi TaxID=752182 RepID=UPI0035A3008A